MTNLISDVENHNPFLLSVYGANYALGFKGDSSFINRCYNWATNTGVVHKGARLLWYYEKDTGRLAYVCPKSVSKIIEGLKLQFRAEIIASREIPPLRDELVESEDEAVEPVYHLEFDETGIEKLSAQRADEFMSAHVMKDNFVLDRPVSIAPIYAFHTPFYSISAD